jgi:hypothetical protein
MTVRPRRAALPAPLFALCLAGCVLGVPREAAAYRPFDGTDAAVAERGVFEWEQGAALARQAGHNYVGTPAVLNLGVARELEAVVDLEPRLGLEPPPGEERFQLLGTDVFLKWVFVRGALQGEPGPSVAVEGGPLLPEFHGDARFGAQASLIASERWRFAQLHLNAQGAWSRRGNPGGLGSVIFEGLPRAKVRPVLELLAARTRHEGATLSALAGAIWAASEALDVDAALRSAHEGEHAVVELRVGVTWAVPFWSAEP